MPPRLTAQDFDQELLVLFDAYVHGDLDRRGFLEQARRFAKAGMTAAGLLAAIGVLTYRWVFRPLRHLGHGSRRVAAGDTSEEALRGLLLCLVPGYAEDTMTQYKAAFAQIINPGSDPYDPNGGQS